MKATRNAISLLLFLAIAAATSPAGNRMYFVRVSADRVEVRLQLEVPIAGFQFSVSLPDNIPARDFVFDGEFTDGSWITGSRIHGDSAVNALAMSLSRQSSLPAGEWTIGSFSVDLQSIGVGSVSLSFAQALISDQDAQALDLMAEALMLNPNDWYPSEGSEREGFTLSAPYPNPFNPSTVLHYVLRKAGDVRITVVDLLGREVRVLEDGFRQAGGGSASWDGTDAAGRPVASGMYFLAMVHAQTVQVQRAFLQK